MEPELDPSADPDLEAIASDLAAIEATLDELQAATEPPEA